MMAVSSTPTPDQPSGVPPVSNGRSAPSPMRIPAGHEDIVLVGGVRPVCEFFAVILAVAVGIREVGVGARLLAWVQGVVGQVRVLDTVG